MTYPSYEEKLYEEIKKSIRAAFLDEHLNSEKRLKLAMSVMGCMATHLELNMLKMQPEIDLTEFVQHFTMVYMASVQKYICMAKGMEPEIDDEQLVNMSLNSYKSLLIAKEVGT